MERTFRDSKGREWTVAVDGYVLYRARTHGKVDLSAIVKQAMDGGSIDPGILVELAFYGCEHHSRIEAGKVSKEDFLRALKGSAMQPALEATAAAVMECFGVEPDEEGEGEGEGPNAEGPPENGASTIGSGSPASPASTPGAGSNSET